MADTTLVQDLDRSRPEDFDARARDLYAAGTHTVGVLVELAHDADPEVRVKASMLLLRLGSLALSPLLAAEPPDRLKDQLWDLELAVDLHRQTRRELIARLADRLEDTTVVVEPDFLFFADQLPPERRVCDAAYAMARAVVVDEPEETRTAQLTRFWSLADDRRDEILAAFRASEAWQRAQAS